MSVARFLTVSDNSSLAEYQVGGTTFAPVGDVTTLDGAHAEKEAVRTEPVNRLVEICAFCNDAKIAYNAVSPDSTTPYCNADISGHGHLCQRWRTHRGRAQGAR
jgi:Ca2+ transporting ATPase